MAEPSLTVGLLPRFAYSVWPFQTPILSLPDVMTTLYSGTGSSHQRTIFNSPNDC